MSSVVPEGWDFCPIGNHIEVLTDYTANGSFASLKENVQYFNEKSYAALVRTTDLEKGTFCPQRFTDKKGYEFLKKSSLKCGDIVIANVGSAGKAYRVPDANMPMTLAPNMYLVKFCKSMDNNFAFQVITNEKFYSDLMSNVGSSTLNAINKSNFRSISIFVPPLPEQKKIASILTSVDEVIENTQKQIDKLQDLKKATMNELLTKGIGHTEFKDSELGRIPKSWECKKLGEVGKCLGGFAFKSQDASSEGTPWLKIANVGVGVVKWNDRSFLPKTFSGKHPNFVLRQGDIVCAMTRPILNGKLKVATISESDAGALLNQRVCKITPYGKIVDVFLFHLLQSDFIVEQIDIEIAGSDPPNVSGEQIESVWVTVPSIEEQRNYAGVIDSIQNRINILSLQLSQTQSLKKSLMQDLLTGKVRVTVN